MKRRYESAFETHEEDKGSPFDALGDETIHHIFYSLFHTTDCDDIAHLEANLVNLMGVCPRFKRIATSNTLWLHLFYHLMMSSTNKDATRRQSAQLFFKWLDIIIENDRLDANLMSMPLDNLDVAREYILFKPGTRQEIRSVYKDYPATVTARLCLQPVAEGNDVYFTSSSPEDVHVICRKIAALLNLPFDSIYRGIQCSQTINADVEIKNAFTMHSLFPRFEGHILWCTIYKLCHLNAVMWQAYEDQKTNLVNLWQNVLTAQTREIGASFALHSSVNNSISDIPTIWTRPTLEDMRQHHTYHPMCMVCNMPMPFVVKTSGHITSTLEMLNPFTTMKGQICTSACFIKAVQQNSNLMIDCANPQCGRTLDIHQATGYYMDEGIYLPNRKIRIHGGVCKAASNIRFDIFKQELRETILENLQFANYIVARYTQRPLDALNLPRRPSDDQVEMMDSEELNEEENMGITGDPSCTSIFPVMTNHRLRHATKLNHYLTRLPVQIQANLFQQTHGFSEQIWDDRLKTYGIVRSKLLTEIPSLPWMFFGAGLPALDRFFPFAFVSTVDSTNKENTRYKVYCSLSCKRLGDGHRTRSCSSVPCLNVMCHRRFNIAEASLMLHGFELKFKNVSRGYVCDYFCRDAYLAQRQEELQMRKKYRC